MILLARLIALLWAGFWMSFIIAESIATNTPFPNMTLWVGVGLLFLFLAILPWRYPHIAGMLLLAAAAITTLVYTLRPPPHLPPRIRVLTTAVLSLPPLAAGLLLLIALRSATPDPQRHP